MNGQSKCKRTFQDATFYGATTSKTEQTDCYTAIPKSKIVVDATTDVTEKDSDLESGGEGQFSKELSFTSKSCPKRLTSPVDLFNDQTRKVSEAFQGFTFYDMPDSCEDQVLQPIYHKPRYELPIPTNPKYQHLSLKSRAKLHGDYLSNISDIMAKRAKISYQMAPQPKPILTSPHCKSSLLKDTDKSEEPTGDQNDLTPQDVHHELYVSRSGRQIKRKVYTEDSDGEVDISLELISSKRNKIDNDDTKLTIETPVVNADSSSKLSDDQKGTKLKRSYPATPKRSLLTTKRTRSEIMFDNLEKNSKKQEQHKAVMEAFQKTLREQDIDDEVESDPLCAFDDEEVEANFVPRRVPPPIPVRKNKNPPPKQKALDLEAITVVPPSPNQESRSRLNKRPELDKKSKTLSVDSIQESVNCPICERLFTMDKIYEHAATCSDFAVEPDPPQTGVKTTINTCQLCDKNFLAYQDFISHTKHCVGAKVDSW